MRILITDTRTGRETEVLSLEHAAAFFMGIDPAGYQVEIFVGGKSELKCTGREFKTSWNRTATPKYDLTRANELIAKMDAIFK